MKKTLLTAIILSTAMKYGPNGYSSLGTSSITQACQGKTCTTNTTNSDVLSNRIQPVGGLTLQSVPDERWGLSFGAGYYMDQTATFSLGLRL
jgi:hypothetical protein